MHTRRTAPTVRAAAAAEPAAAPAGGPGGLSVREEKLPGCATRLHVTVPAEQCRAAYSKFMNDLRKGTRVDGFRKGKAPDAALIAHVGGMGRVVNSVLADMLEPAVAQVGWETGVLALGGMGVQSVEPGCPGGQSHSQRVLQAQTNQAAQAGRARPKMGKGTPAAFQCGVHLREMRRSSYGRVLGGGAVMPWLAGN